MMDIVVNQSWKIEQTNRDTRVAAMKGGDSFAVIIDRRLRRWVLQNYRERFSNDKDLYVRMFGAAAFLAIQPLYAKGDKIIIDLECPEHERKIIRHITSLVIRSFQHLPKGRSYSHWLAINLPHIS